MLCTTVNSQDQLFPVSKNILSRFVHLDLSFYNKCSEEEIFLNAPLKRKKKTPWSEPQRCRIKSSSQASIQSSLTRLRCDTPVCMSIPSKLPVHDRMFHPLMNSFIFPDRQMCGAHPQHLWESGNWRKVPGSTQLSGSSDASRATSLSTRRTAKEAAFDPPILLSEAPEMWTLPPLMLMHHAAWICKCCYNRMSTGMKHISPCFRDV